MGNNRIVVGTLMACLALQACSSKPREFTPQIAASSTSQAEFDAAYATCQELLVAGKLDASGRASSAAAGAGAAAGTAALGGTAAAAAGGYGGLAVAGATVVLLPFALIGGAWGMSRMKRARKERVIKTSMEGCLRERGYEVAGWTNAARKPLMAGPEVAAQ